MIYVTQFFADMIQKGLDFSRVLNTSISTSWLILMILLLRFLLKKAPKWLHVMLWGVAALRLLLPVSIESSFSLIPSTETVPHEIFLYEGTQRQESAYLDLVANPIFQDDLSLELNRSVDRLELQIMELTFVWLAGILLMLLYTIFSYLQIRRKVNTAVRIRPHLYQSEYVESPFVLGILRPRIYLPFRINPQDLEHVIAHEEAHIHRRDHWWKPLGFLLLSIHWFNPLMWLAYILLCRDIELACDEKVIRNLNPEQRANYSQALLTCSIRRPMVSACPLAFGETDVRKRIRSVLQYKKPAFWVVLVTMFACMMVAICFLTTPPDKRELDAGTYVSYQCIYMNPFSSYMGFGGDSGYVYRIEDDYFTIVKREADLLYHNDSSKDKIFFTTATSNRENRIHVSDWSWQKFPYTDQEWAALYEPDMNSITNISEQYRERLYLPLNDNLFLLKMDDCLWLVQLSNNPTVGTYLWSIYSLVPESTMGDAQWEYAPYLNSPSPLLRIQFDMEHTQVSAVCTESPLANVDTESYSSDFSMTYEQGNAMCWSPMNSEGLPVLTATIHFTIHQGNESAYHGTLYINGHPNKNRILYDIALTGTGLQLAVNKESEGCVISLVK